MKTLKIPDTSPLPYSAKTAETQIRTNGCFYRESSAL